MKSLIICLVLFVTANSYAMGFNCEPGVVGVDEAGNYEISVKNCLPNVSGLDPESAGIVMVEGVSIDSKIDLFVKAKLNGKRIWFVADPMDFISGGVVTIKSLFIL